MKFKEMLENIKTNELINAKMSYSAIGGKDNIGKFNWNMDKKKIILKNIKKQKPIVCYRTFSVSEKEWQKMFDAGYTEIGNINLEKGLTSFTIDKKMKTRFLGGNDVTIELEIKLKNYIEILEDSLYPEEQEILANDVKWKVTALDEEARNWYIIGEQI